MNTAKEYERIPKPRWVLKTYEKGTDRELGKLIKEVITPMERVFVECVVSFDFACKCGKRKGKLGVGVSTTPCPVCGRVYIGVEEETDYGSHIRACEVVREDGE